MYLTALSSPLSLSGVICGMAQNQNIPVRPTPMDPDARGEYSLVWGVSEAAVEYWHRVCDQYRMFAIAFAFPVFFNGAVGTMLLTSNARTNSMQSDAAIKYPTLGMAEAPWLAFDVFWLPGASWYNLSTFYTLDLEYLGPLVQVAPLFMRNGWQDFARLVDGEMFDGLRRLLIENGIPSWMELDVGMSYCGYKSLDFVCQYVWEPQGLHSRMNPMQLFARTHCLHYVGASSFFPQDRMLLPCVSPDKWWDALPYLRLLDARARIQWTDLEFGSKPIVSHRPLNVFQMHPRDVSFINRSVLLRIFRGQFEGKGKGKGKPARALMHRSEL